MSLSGSGTPEEAHYVAGLECFAPDEGVVVCDGYGAYETLAKPRD